MSQRYPHPYPLKDLLLQSPQARIEILRLKSLINESPELFCVDEFKDLCIEKEYVKSVFISLDPRAIADKRIRKSTIHAERIERQEINKVKHDLRHNTIARSEIIKKATEGLERAMIQVNIYENEIIAELSNLCEELRDDYLKSIRK